MEHWFYPTMVDQFQLTLKLEDLLDQQYPAGMTVCEQGRLLTLELASNRSIKVAVADAHLMLKALPIEGLACQQLRLLGSN